LTRTARVRQAQRQDQRQAPASPFIEAGKSKMTEAKIDKMHT